MPGAFFQHAVWPVPLPRPDGLTQSSDSLTMKSAKEPRGKHPMDTEASAAYDSFEAGEA